MHDRSDDWSTWLARYGAALVLFARQWVPTHADAEDVVQEAFARFWRSRRRANDATAYLYASVRTCALDWRRGDQRRSRREETVARVPADTLFIDAAENDERQKILKAALGTLPPEQREVLVLKIWGGLSFPQIADALELSANTAASRYRYALAKLRERLTEESVL